MKYRGVLSEYAALWEMLLRLGDALAVLASGWLAAAIYLDGLPDKPGYAFALILAVLLCLVIFPAFGLYRPWRGIALGEELRTLSLAWLTSFGTLTFFAFVTKTGPDFSRVWFFIWVGSGWVIVLAGRIALRLLQRAMRRRGFNLRRVVIVGSAAMAEELTKRLAAAPWTGLIVAESFPFDKVADDGYAALVSRVGTGGIDQVWIAAPLKGRQRSTACRMPCATAPSTSATFRTFQVSPCSTIRCPRLPVCRSSASAHREWTAWIA